MKISWVVTLLLASCGGSTATPPPPHRDDAAMAAEPSRLDAGGTVAMPAQALGLADLAAWQWRARAGHPAFQIARKAEGRNDWAGVATACTQALAADPTNLEAAWLEAVALAKLGKLDQVTHPLVRAGLGDFGKWGIASLDQPALQPYLSTAEGQAWRARVTADRATFTAALTHAVLVIAKGDVFAVEITASGQRWYRLTRTFGGVVAAFAAPGGHQLAYVTRGKLSHKLAIGGVDLESGLTTRPQPLAPVATQIAFVPATATVPSIGFWVGQLGKPARVLALAAGDHQGLLIATTLARPAGAWLDVGATGGERLHRATGKLSADWDDQGFASAIRIASSNRVVTVPGQIARDTIAWSPDGTHLVFVAQIAERCDATTPTVAAYVVDTATGAATERARGHGLAIAWVGDRTLALAGIPADAGVTLHDLGGATTATFAGATNLVVPRFAARCEPEAVEPAGSTVVEPDEDGSEN